MLGAAALVVIAVAIAAMVKPLIYACRLNPLEALREE
jgi:hypothetical protein